MSPRLHPKGPPSGSPCSPRNFGILVKGFFLINELINVWLPWVFVAVRRLSWVAASRVYSLVAMRGLLIAAASFVIEHGL